MKLCFEKGKRWTSFFIRLAIWLKVRKTLRVRWRDITSHVVVAVFVSERDPADIGHYRYFEATTPVVREIPSREFTRRFVTIPPPWPTCSLSVDEPAALKFLEGEVGRTYDYLELVQGMTERRGIGLKGAYICSSLAARCIEVAAPGAFDARRLWTDLVPLKEHFIRAKVR